MKKRKFFISILAVCVLVTTSISSLASGFSDVDSGTVYEQSIDWMADQGVVEGYSDGTFRPDSCVNRVEFLKLLYEVSKSELAINGTVPFPDTYEDQWYHAYLLTAYNEGVVEGYPDGNFRPEQCVNRAEGIKMAMEKYYDEFDNGMTSFYALPYDFEEIYDQNYLFDTANDWFFPYVITGLNRSVVPTDHFERVQVDYNGDGEVDADEAFLNPRFNIKLNGSMTRQEVVELFYRLKSVKDNGLDYYNYTKPFPMDGNPDHDLDSGLTDVFSSEKNGYRLTEIPFEYEFSLLERDFDYSMLSMIFMEEEYRILFITKSGAPDRGFGFFDLLREDLYDEEQMCEELANCVEVFENSNGYLVMKFENFVQENIKAFDDEYVQDFDDYVYYVQHPWFNYYNLVFSDFDLKNSGIEYLEENAEEWITILVENVKFPYNDPALQF